MSDNETMPGLFPGDGEQRAPNVLTMRTTGVIPYQGLRNMVRTGELTAPDPIDPDQIQPASLDLRLGRRAYRVRASFLPGRNATVMSKVKQLDGLPAIDLTNGAVFERGAVYVVELLESARLTNGVEGTANPKSSTGRLDVLTRLITDHATAFDRIEKGYKGPLFVEVAPLSFNIVVRTGSRLNQLRFHRGTATVSSTELERLYTSGQIIKVDGERPPLTPSKQRFPKTCYPPRKHNSQPCPASAIVNRPGELKKGGFLAHHSL
jgi:dCTP deaminase